MKKYIILVMFFASNLFSQARMSSTTLLKGELPIPRNALPLFGLRIENSESNAVRVLEVLGDTPADKKGFKVDDLIIKINEQNAVDLIAIKEIVKNIKPLQEVKITYRRAGIDSTISMKTGAYSLLPGSTGMKWQGMQVGQKVMNIKQDWGMEFHFILPQLAKYFGIYEEGDKFLTYGILVKNVSKKSLPEKAGFKAGDIILFLNNKRIRENHDFFPVIQNCKASDIFVFKVKRNSSVIEIPIPLGNSLTNDENGISLKWSAEEVIKI